MTTSIPTGSESSIDIPIRGSRTYYGVMLLGCAAFVVSGIVRSIGGIDFVCLELRSPEKFEPRMGGVQKAMRTANRKLGFTDFSIGLQGLTVRPETLLELIVKKSAEAEVGTAP